MLDAMRRGANTYVAKILLGLLMASFAVWGISSSVVSRNQTSVAVVGSTKIEPARFQALYQRQIQLYAEKTGRNMTAEESIGSGIPQMVLNTLVNDAALSELSSSLDLGLSDERLSGVIRADKMFFNRAGVFDKTYFDRVAQNLGYSERAFLAYHKSIALQGQITDALGRAVPVPATLDQAVFDLRNQVRTIDYVVVPRVEAASINAPTDEELTGYFEANKANYALPEFRKVAYVAATPETLTDPSAVTDAEAKAVYDRNLASYTTPEKRHVRQLIVPGDAADKVAAALKEGKSLDEAADTAGLKATIADLGSITKAEIIDPAVADSAFALEEGKASGVISGKFGPVVVEVSGIAPTAVQPFEAVAQTLKTRIAAEKAARSVMSYYDKIEDARSGGKSLQDISRQFQLPLVTVDEVSARGLDANGKPVANLPRQADLVSAAFKTEAGQLNDPLQYGRTGFVWYDVVSVTPRRDRKLEEITDRVKADWVAARQVSILDATASGIEKALNAGKSFAEAAPALAVTHSTAFSRTSRADGVLTDNVMSAAFSVKKGRATTALAPDGGKVVLQVASEITPPYVANAGISPAEKDKVQQGYDNDLMAQLVDRQRDLIGTTYNQALMNQIIGLGNN